MKDSFRNWLRRTVSPRVLLRWNHLMHVEDRLYDVERRRAQLAEIVLRDRFPGLLAEADGREFSVFSQNGEDGLLLSLLEQAGAPSKRFVEIGIENARECNCAVLGFVMGWSGRMIEANPLQAAAAARFADRVLAGRDNRVEIVAARAEVANVNALIGSEPIDVLSIDVDSIDYWLWEAVTARPRVAVIEYNASLGLESLTMPLDAKPEGYYHGTSLVALERLAKKKGYSLAAVDSRGVNAFFVLDGARGPMRAEALYRPHAMRLRIHSQDEQWALLRERRWERV